jgi:hypothetical protein
MEDGRKGWIKGGEENAERQQDQRVTGTVHMGLSTLSPASQMRVMPGSG